jgi:hypothetical protein
MRDEDLIAFARRDWQAIALGRFAFWAERYRREGGGPARRAATQLYDHARRICMGAFDERHRAADFADHVRLREQLDRAARALAGR